MAKRMDKRRIGRLLKFLLSRAARRRKHAKEEFIVLEKEEGNPYLPALREITEEILKKKKIPYARFAPVFIDGGDVKKTLLAAELLAKDLNRLTILTDRPAYFETYADMMYEEEGLIVEILPKDPLRIAALSSEKLQGNVILDFEEKKERKNEIQFGKKLYIPLFKKSWEPVENLDIAVPIGYNTVIVRSRKAKENQPYYDKFERAFYENE